MAVTRRVDIAEEVPPFRLTATAFSLAVKWHGRQVRKGSGVPYLTHLMDVSSLVLVHGGDDVQAAAALLHDAIEDASSADEAGAREELIRYRLGDPVGDIVIACTDGRPDERGAKAPWQVRTTRHLEHLVTAPAPALLVSCCDKLHNARAIVHDLGTIGEQVWTRFSASKSQSLWYYDRLARVFVDRGVGPWQTLAETVDAMHRLAGVPRETAAVEG